MHAILCCSAHKCIIIKSCVYSSLIATNFHNNRPHIYNALIIIVGAILYLMLLIDYLHIKVWFMLQVVSTANIVFSSGSFDTSGSYTDHTISVAIDMINLKRQRG